MGPSLLIQSECCMNRILSVFCLLSLLAFAGCDKYVTEQYITEGATLQTVYITAEKNAWAVYGTPGEEGCYMYQTFEFPEITKNVIDNGAVLVYSLGTEGDVMLPYLLPYADTPVSVYENIYFDCKEGSLTIIIESSDFAVVDRKSDMEFKVTIIKP